MIKLCAVTYLNTGFVTSAHTSLMQVTAFYQAMKLRKSHGFATLVKIQQE